jgi:hypothetical protein
MTMRVHQLSTVVVLAAAILFLWPGSVPSQPEKKADPKAGSIAKEWRYPGVGTADIISLSHKPQALYVEQYTLKTEYADVWNHFATKVGSDGRYNDLMSWAVIGDLNAPDKGHFMVFGDSQETIFAQNSDKTTIHVEIRRSGDKKTLVIVLVGVR